MRLCPQGAAAWRGNPCLPSRACRFSSALTAKAYGAAGQAASALYAMALLQVHQAKALKQLHEGDADLALRATKVTARALGQTMSTLVVQERHLWLTLADTRESDKHRFLDSPISQAGLFGEAVEDFAQQFSAAQKQTEAFRHILLRRSAAVSTPPPVAAPPSARRRRRPPAASTSAPARPQQQPSQRPQHGAGRRKAVQPASTPAKPVKRQGRWRPWDGRPGASGSCSSGDGDSTTPFPGGGPGGEFLFCSATGPRVKMLRCQAPVQDVDAETHFSMRPSLRLGCSDRPERRLLPCLDPPSNPLCVQRASIPVGTPLRAPQPVGASGQPGKEQTLPYAEDLFSRHGVGLGQPHSTSLRGACSVNAEMPGVSPAQESGSTETFSEAPGAYGILSRYHAAWIASYETASALASRPSPEMGMAPRHIPGLTHSVLPPHLQPMVGPCFSSVTCVTPVP